MRKVAEAEMQRVQKALKQKYLETKKAMAHELDLDVDDMPKMNGWGWDVENQNEDDEVDDDDEAEMENSKVEPAE